MGRVMKRSAIRRLRGLALRPCVRLLKLFHLVRGIRFWCPAENGGNPNSNPIMKSLLLILVALSPLALFSAIPDQASAGFERTEDVIYGRKFGVALTLDVLRPTKTDNHRGIISLVSGGWLSRHDEIDPATCQEYLDRGYTVFVVVHGSQPKFTIPEIIQDIHRAVRYVRHSATRWGIDPARLGITGGSAGGHLCLTIATQGGPGDPAATDPIDRESSAVQAVGCFYPPTDFLNYGSPNEDGVGVGRLAQFRPAFGAEADSPASRARLGRQISPIYFITSSLPPTLLIHGDADATVPLQQSEIFIQAATKAGAKAELIVVPGAGHGQRFMPGKKALLAAWFDEYLLDLKK
jgi:acetyl esterase/lipase